MRFGHRSLLVVVAVICVAAVAGMVALWPSSGAVDAPETEAAEADLVGGQTQELLDATLLEVTPAEVDEDFGLMPDAVDVTIRARIASTGEDVTFTTTDDTGDLYEAGQEVRLARISDPVAAEPTYYINDFQRARPMALLAGLFVLAVVVFGRLQGLRALLGLGVSVAVIIGFIVPAILAGQPPVVVAVVGAAVIMVATLYLSHGLSPKTTAAVVGTAGALVLTAALAQIFVDVTSLTGFSSEEARLAAFEVTGLSLEGLLLAGIIVGGLGVLDDVTISQASTVFELRQASPDAGFARLLTGALNVGRDHISATINTLFLAYAGAALPLLILFTLSDQGVGTVVTSEIVAVEIVRTLVGSIGLIAAVPLTSALAVALALGARPGRRARRRRAIEAEEEEWLQRLRDV